MPKPDLRSKPEQILAPISQHPNVTHDNKSQLRTYDGFLTSHIVDPALESCSTPRREHLKFPYTLARKIKLKPSKVAWCPDENVSLLLRSWRCFFFSFISDVLQFLHWTISISKSPRNRHIGVKVCASSLGKEDWLSEGVRPTLPDKCCIHTGVKCMLGLTD